MMLSLSRLSWLLVLAACGSPTAAAPAVDDQCRQACHDLAPSGCESQCAQKCRGACLAAPSDLRFDFASTTKIACAPEGGAVSFEIERDADPTLLACN